MRLLLAIFCSAALILPAAAHSQQQDQAPLDALLAPVALYPDDVVRIVLDAATAPQEVAAAADWSRNNQGMTAEDSVRAVEGYGWRPSVKALVAYPDLLQRMAESPQWTSDLGNAWISQQPQVMATIQTLRQRAQASGTLRSDQYQTVQSTDQGIAVVPTMPYIYYVPYYNPLVVYGGWWGPAYQPVYWRPWYARPVFVTRVAVVNRGFVVNRPFPGHGGFVARNGTPSPAGRMQQQESAQFVGRQQSASRPSPAVQMQNRMSGTSFHPQGPTRPALQPPVHTQPYVQSRGTPYVQSHGGPIMQSHAAPPSNQRASSGAGRPAGGGYHGGGHSGGGHGGGGHGRS